MVENKAYFDDFVKLISKEESTMGKQWSLWVIVVENWQSSLSYNVCMTFNFNFTFELLWFKSFIVNYINPP